MFICVFRRGSHPGRGLVKPVEFKQGCKRDKNEALVFPDILPTPGAVLGQHSTEERDFPSLRHVAKGICDVEGERNAPQSESRSEPTILHCSHKHPRKASPESTNPNTAFSSSKLSKSISKDTHTDLEEALALAGSSIFSLIA